MKSKYLLPLMFLVLLVLALWWATQIFARNRDRSRSEAQAVHDAVVALEFYLPRLVGDPDMARFVDPPEVPGFHVSSDRVQRLRNREEEERRAREHAENAQGIAAGMKQQLARVSGRTLQGITGAGFAPPVWNIQGHHYLTANRQAHFGAVTIPIKLIVVHPRVYRHRMDPGLEILNASEFSGVADVGHLKVEALGNEWTIWVSHPGVDHGYSTESAELSSAASQPSDTPDAALADLIVGGLVTNATTGHYYCLLAEHSFDGTPIQWTDAQRVAEELGGYLVVIDSEQEQRWVESQFLKDKNLWIGLKDLDRNGVYAWVNGETSTYQHWAPGEPSSQHETFVHMWSNTFRPGEGGMWNDSTDMFFEVQAVLEFEPGKPLSGR